MRLGDGWLDSHLRTLDEYECPDCGGNHVAEYGWHDCDDCSGTGVAATDESRPLPLVMPESFGHSRWKRATWSSLIAWDGDKFCESCDGDGRLLCETCEAAFYEWEGA